MNSLFHPANLALMIPIVAIIAAHLRKWQTIDLDAANRDVDLRRRFRSFDEIERRVGDIERHVTSRDYHLNREIARLASPSQFRQCPEQPL